VGVGQQAMANIDSLSNLLTGIAYDVSATYAQKGIDAFNQYYSNLGIIAKPYIRNGFLDEEKSKERFMAETAMLHLASTLIEKWCVLHEISVTHNFLDFHDLGSYFGWYKLPNNLTLEIALWVQTNPDIQDAPQIISLLAENSLVGLRRRSLGEFYTPTQIAEHLYSLTGFNPINICSQKIVDPACGSGNLLRVVVSDVVKSVLNGRIDPTTAIAGLNNNIYGYDIQPVAVLMTKLQLLLVSLPILEKSHVNSKSIYEFLPFDNIKLIDPLSNPKDYWDIFAQFDLVIGNPPYLKVIKDKLPSKEGFEDIFFGQPNLYQMFLWWAIRATRSNGNITFLIPQSIRSGQYFRKLRIGISKACQIKAITCFTDQEGVFDTVKQQMMIISLHKANDQTQPDVIIRKSSNGDNLGCLKEIRLHQNQVLLESTGESLWYISDSELDYEILSGVYNYSKLLKNIEGIAILNGGFVWNQNKPILRRVSEGNTVPLISAGSIGVHQFTFPPKDERLQKRLFVEREYGLSEPGYSTRSILIKRTTPKKLQGRRIIACELPTTFLEIYPVYFCENHVNLIILTNETEHYLAGLTAWLNSKLANFIFGMMNGSSHLSKYELGLLPVSEDLLDKLETMTQINDRQKMMSKVDELILAFYNLSPQQIERVNHIVPSLA